MNLFSNAVKFTPPEGSIHFEARLLSEKDDIAI
jgi:signal transduction histidine kinase